MSLPARVLSQSVLNILCTAPISSCAAAGVPALKAFSTAASNVKNANPLQLLAQLDVFEQNLNVPTLPTDVKGPEFTLPVTPDKAHPLMVYKAQYPDAVWNAISDLFKGKRFPDVVDVNCTGGRSAIELAKRGFRVIGIESSATMLAQTQVRARGAGVELQLLGAERERQLLRDQYADLFTVMHGFHLLDVPSALAEAHRILKPEGYLVAAWNDRSMEFPFTQELEDIMESYNPQYNRSQKQRDPEVWAPILTQGDLFRLNHYSKHLHSLQLTGFKVFTSLVYNLHALRDLVHNDPVLKKSLQADLRKLVLRHSPSLDNIPVPMETELYILGKN